MPIAGAWKFYRALKAHDKTVEFDIYPRGGHVLFEPMQEREEMRRNLAWFSRWIRSEPPKAGSPVHGIVVYPPRGQVGMAPTLIK